jgi:hypothetical protein
MDKLLCVFNNSYYNFIEDLLSLVEKDNKLFDGLTSALESKDKHATTTHRFIERYGQSLKPNIFATILENQDFIKEESVKPLRIIRKITINDIIESVSNVDNEMLKTYIYTFSLLAYVYSKCADLESSDSESDESDESDASKVDLINKVLHYLNLVQNGETCDLGEVDDKNIVTLITNLSKIATKNSFRGQETPTPNSSDLLQNTKIGSLAKEISEEIDLSKLNLDKPEELLNPAAILSGGGGNTVLTDIISKVGSKIHEKIDKGELKHEELMSEAFGMLGMLGKSGDSTAASFLNNPMFKDVMKNMGGAMNMAKNSDRAKSSHVRDRLRKKLESKGKDGKLL